MKTKENSLQFYKDKQLRICVLGGGNIGTLLLGDLGSKEGISTRLLTSKPHMWNYRIRVYNSDNTLIETGRVDIISNNPKEVVADADIIISTLPSHVFPKVINNIKPFVKTGAWIGLMPGSGGSEFYCMDLIREGQTLFAFQRVHGISRVKEYGRSVYDLGKKDELHIASIPGNKANEICLLMEELLNIRCNPLDNYLNVTLTPSNPILHTTRLYEMFSNYKDGMYWDRAINFYEEWTDEASRMLMACDEELQKFCSKLSDLDLSGVKSLKDHYESQTPEEMTKKIRSIIAFKGIKAPMVETENGYIPDFNSRYFLEDFPYGLCIIKSFCNITDIETPAIDKVLMWYERMTDTNYYIDGNFIGADLNSLPLPQNYNLDTTDDVVMFYGYNG